MCLRASGAKRSGRNACGSLPHVGQPVRGPRGVVDRRALGDAVAARTRTRARRGAGRSRPAGRGAASRRAPGRAAAGRRPAGDLRVAGELVEQERDRRGRGVVAGEQQRHHVVADVAVAETRRVEQQRQHVLAAARRCGGGRRSRRRSGRRAARATPAGSPTACAGRAAPAASTRARRSRARARSRARVRLESASRAEQRAHARRAARARAPTRRGRARGRRASARSARSISSSIDAERRRDALVVEGREHDPARLLVEVAVDREHPVAEQRDQVAEAAVAPAEVVGVGDEHEVVRLRAEHEDVARVEDPQREDRPVALVGLEQQVAAGRRSCGACGGRSATMSPGG